MTYLYKKNNRFDPKYIGFVLAVLFFLLVKFTGLGTLVGSIVSPLFSFGDNVYKNINDVPEKFWSKEDLLHEIESIREREKELNLKLTDISALQLENRQLREGLKLKPTGDYKTAFVIARPPQTSFDTLLIDRGEESGIKVGDFVLASNSSMVGKVVEVRGYSSVVLLNSSPVSYFAATISRNDNPIEVFGHGSSNLYTKVPVVVDIEVGDTIAINYGKVFSIGVVKEIQDEETSGFKNIFISLPVNISDLSLVFIFSPTGDAKPVEDTI